MSFATEGFSAMMSALVMIFPDLGATLVGHLPIWRETTHHLGSVVLGIGADVLITTALVRPMISVLSLTSQASHS